MVIEQHDDAVIYSRAVVNWAKRRGWKDTFDVDCTIQVNGRYTSCALLREGKVIGLGATRCSPQDINDKIVGAVIALWRALDAAAERANLAS